MANNNFDLLKQLTHPENIEVLANENCLPNCPHRDLHFKIYSAIQLGRIKVGDNILGGCLNEGAKTEENVKDIQIPMEDFIKNYLPLGINKLKIVGRCTEQKRLADIYAEWLAKPEYQEEIRRQLNE